MPRFHDAPRWRPLEVRTAEAGAEATAVSLADTDRSDELLTAEKALVFRGFHVAPEDLSTVMDLVLPERLAYVHGNSPRTKVGDNVYTSTEYPAEFTISMHNELSYAAAWPRRLLFYCETAPATGGATPVVDGVAWLAALGDAVREDFAGGLRY